MYKHVPEEHAVDVFAKERSTLRTHLALHQAIQKRKPTSRQRLLQLQRAEASLLHINKEDEKQSDELSWDWPLMKDGVHPPRVYITKIQVRMQRLISSMQRTLSRQSTTQLETKPGTKEHSQGFKTKWQHGSLTNTILFYQWSMQRRSSWLRQTMLMKVSVVISFSSFCCA